jgi:hypothetical protein
MSRIIARHRRFNAAGSRAKTLRPTASRIRCAGRKATGAAVIHSRRARSVCTGRGYPIILRQILPSSHTGFTHDTLLSAFVIQALG